MELELEALLEVEVVEVLTPHAGVVDEVELEVLVELVLVVVVEDQLGSVHCGTATAEPARARATAAVENFIFDDLGGLERLFVD